MKYNKRYGAQLNMIHYLSGPMSGIKDFNYPTFERAQHRLEAQGFETRSPHQIDDLERQLNPRHDPSQDPDTYNWQWYMTRALRMQLQCDAWVGLAGWPKSRGAMREFQIAVDLGHQLFLYREADPKFGSSGLEPLL